MMIHPASRPPFAAATSDLLSGAQAFQSLQ
jgi:hypothetical protein